MTNYYSVLSEARQKNIEARQAIMQELGDAKGKDSERFTRLAERYTELESAYVELIRMELALDKAIGKIGIACKQNDSAINSVAEDD